MAERIRKALSQGWRYTKTDREVYKNRDWPDHDWSLVNLPHSNEELPHSDFHPDEFRFVSWYRRSIRLQEPLMGKRLHLLFEGAMSTCDVYVNGHWVGQHLGGYTPFRMDITDYLDESAKNVIAIRLDSKKQLEVPPEGNRVDYLLFGGLYRQVYLEWVEPVHLTDVWVQTKAVDVVQAVLQVQCTTQNDGLKEQEALIQLEVAGVTQENAIFLTPGAEEPILFTVQLDRPQLWDLDAPQLYKANVRLVHETQIKDTLSVSFGIRTVEIAENGLVLNGRLHKLRGLNRHQMFPYVGGAAPDRLQRRDAFILKKELGLNYVRTSHYPQDPAFLAACDEIGLLVFEEIPGWQHIGDEKWQSVALQHLEEMIRRDRNHPAIFMWGVRINESSDHHDFYERTNQLAHALDPTRKTAGVRNFQQSEFLEDVFTYNDFSMQALPAVQRTQLITEFLGHMYPTKSYDPEARLVQHALYHAQIVDQVHGRDDLIGSSGWCAFDYNTNLDFGSGNSICFHGVMDIYRHPKFAANFYKSQRSLEEGPVLEIATYLTSASPEHALLITPPVDPEHYDHHAYHFTIWIFSNVSEVELWHNGHLLGRKNPDDVSFPHLPHAPFRFDIPAYETDGHLRAVGYVAGQALLSHEVYTPSGFDSLSLEADDHQLLASGADMTRVTVTARGRHGERLPYANRPVVFEISGPGELIGENPCPMEGGRATLYIRSQRSLGLIRVQAKSGKYEATPLSLQVVADPEETMPLYEEEI